jgi:chromosome segregation ATPase
MSGVYVIDHLEAEITRLQADKKALAFQLDETIANLARNEAEVERLNAIIAELGHRLEAMGHLPKAKDKEIERLRAQRESSDRVIQVQHTEIERLRKSKTPASRQLLNITKASLDEANAEIKRLKAEASHALQR